MAERKSKPATAAARRASGSRKSPGKQSHGKAAGSPGEQPESPGNQSQSEARAENASPGSSPASSAAAASSPFLANPGADFDGREHAPAGADPIAAPDVAPELLPLQWWTPERAEKVLRGQGALLHALIGVGERDWQWEPPELDAVAPPLADGLNRVEPLQRLAPYADGIGALLGVVGYVQRSRMERARVLAMYQPVEEPVTGHGAEPPAPAPAPAGPEQAEQRQRALDAVEQRAQQRQAGANGAGEIQWRVPE